MREIKFRAWNKEVGYVCNVLDIEFGNSGSEELTVRLSNDVANTFCDKTTSFEIMQYTGLKDMNQTEVYEGDILESNILSGDRRINEVVFQYGAFRIGLQPLHVQTNIIVIGNIHENKDLLNV